MKFNLGCAALIVLCAAGAYWAWGAETWSFGTFLRPLSWFVLFVAFSALVVNAGRIVDWFRAPTPPVVEDPVLGRLTYDDGVWRAPPRERGPLFWLEGRRLGPDPELVRAGSDAVARIEQLEAQARALVEADTGPVTAAPGKPGRLTALTPYRAVYRGEPVIEIRLSFEMPRDDGVLDVYVVGDTMTRVERH